MLPWSRKCGSGSQLYEPAVIIVPSSLPMALLLHMVLTLKSAGWEGYNDRRIKSRGYGI